MLPPTHLPPLNRVRIPRRQWTHRGGQGSVYGSVDTLQLCSRLRSLWREAQLLVRHRHPEPRPNVDRDSRQAAARSGDTEEKVWTGQHSDATKLFQQRRKGIELLLPLLLFKLLSREPMKSLLSLFTVEMSLDQARANYGTINDPLSFLTRPTEEMNWIEWIEEIILRNSKQVIK